MEVTGKPLAKIEGRKRMQASGLTVAWYGTRSLMDWVAYLEDGNDDGRLVLAHQVSEWAVKRLLARIQTLSWDDLRAMGPVKAVAQQGGGPPARSSGGGEAPGPGLTGPSASSRQLVLETLETEQEHLRAELAVLHGEAEGYDGPPSIFVTGWFRPRWC
jgi:hypothetical protein